MDQRYKKIVELLGRDNVKFNEPLAQHTTFRIGGPADLFIEIENEEELVKVLRVVRPTFAKATAGKEIKEVNGIGWKVIWKTAFSFPFSSSPIRTILWPWVFLNSPHSQDCSGWRAS